MSDSRFKSFFPFSFILTHGNYLDRKINLKWISCIGMVRGIQGTCNRKRLGKIKKRPNHIGRNYVEVSTTIILFMCWLWKLDMKPVFRKRLFRYCKHFQIFIGVTFFLFWSGYQFPTKYLLSHFLVKVLIKVSQVSEIHGSSIREGLLIVIKDSVFAYTTEKSNHAKVPFVN